MKMVTDDRNTILTWPGTVIDIYTMAISFCHLVSLGTNYCETAMDMDLFKIRVMFVGVYL